MQTSPKSFTLYSLEIPLLSHCSARGLLEARRKSSTYTLIMSVFPSLLAMRILGSAFSGLNPRVLRNPMTFWFHNQPDCRKPKMLLKSLHTRPALTEWRFLIPGSSRIKIGSSLSPMKLSKYAPTMSIYSTKSLSSGDTARKTLKDLCLTVGAKVSLKLI